jgi:opine dehydrogenase
MSTADFIKVTEAFSKRSAPLPFATSNLANVTILGAGPEARALACQCLAEGANVTLFSAYAAEMDPLRKAGSITIRGEGPVGTYQVGEGALAIRLSAELDAAAKSADLIFVTGPALKQRTYSMVLAGHLHDGQVLVLVNGRTMGAIEMAWYLRVGGERAKATIVELQNPLFWARAEGSTLHLSKPASLVAAALPSGALPDLHKYLPGLQPLQNVIQSGFHDGSGIVETVALMQGGPALPDGGVALPPGAQALGERNVFRRLIGANHLKLIEGLATERHAVAARWGVRDLPNAGAWIDAYAGAEAGAGSRPMPMAAEAAAIIRCAVIGSLAPLVSAARTAGIDVPLTSAMIALAAAMLGGDLLHAGRSLDAIGISAGSIDDARRAVERIAQGAW